MIARCMYMICMRKSTLTVCLFACLFRFVTLVCLSQFPLASIIRPTLAQVDVGGLKLVTHMCVPSSVVLSVSLCMNRRIATLSNHVSVVTSLAFSEDGSVLLTGGRDKVVNAWNLKTFKLLKTIGLYEVYILALSPLR